MTTVAMAADTAVYELVVYRIKNDYKDQYQEALSAARKFVQKQPGLITYQTFRSTENNTLFMDLVTWNSLEEALRAAKKVEQAEEMADFMKAFEEIKFMEHFESIDFKNTQRFDLLEVDPEYYTAGLEPKIVILKPYDYLSISGVSAPEDPLFLNAIEAIYTVAHGIKVEYKSQNKDFVVPKMEAQWWVEGPLAFEKTPRNEWHWNIVIPMPEYVKIAHVEKVIQQSIEAKGPSLVNEVEFKPLQEGKSIQVLHIGSYEEEGPTLEKIFTFAAENSLEINGHHHEIYLTIPDKTEVDKLKTIIRYPVK